MRTELPEPRTAEGREGLDAVLREPGRALIALDFDGTLAPIVADPERARPHPAAAGALRRLSGLVGTLAVITGRPAAQAVQLGGFADLTDLVILGQYGLQRWQAGVLTSPAPPPGVAAVREALPGVLAQSHASQGTWVEDKGHALAVHTRRSADPAGTLERLRGPLDQLAASAGLTAEPGRLVIELRPHGTDKGSALLSLAAEREPWAVVFAGDDLGDLPAFGAVRTWRATGRPGLTVCSASAEVTELAVQADLVVDGPEGISSLLAALAGALETPSA
ncbi:MAG TPA: trehalose-phosphatase [Streptosporangiaceae bacterium]|nr:trehalose-phosphatase [Streptosporangiaceae bacterium]